MKRAKSRKASDGNALDALHLTAFFPENQSPGSPITESISADLPPPGSLIEIPLPVREKPPRVIIADDEESFLRDLQLSFEVHYQGALDLRYWRPGQGTDLTGMVRQCFNEGWRPDAVVLDINFDDGGKHGVDYLAELRAEPGCAALAVALATGSQFRDLDEDQLKRGATNLTGRKPSQWFQKAKPLEPEAILYGKTGDARFLGRIGEHIDDWRRAARRRAWVQLLREVAVLLDGATVKVQWVADQIVDFAMRELGIDAAFVRQRQRDDRYKLVSVSPTEGFVRKGDLLAIADVPILTEIVDKSREPVLRDALTAEAAGRLHNHIAGQRFIGVGCLLGNRNVGFITMLRRTELEPFDQAVDGTHISVLARLLASAIRVAALRDRQTQLLRFADEAGSAIDRKKVCEKLTATLHEEIHQADDTNAKVTVRLLDSGTGDLERLAHMGFAAIPKKIHLTTTGSIYAEAVRDNHLVLVRECREKPELVRSAVVGEIRSELCVPLSIGHYSIGAVNLEHREVDFYRGYDEEFVQAAASLAANAIERIRTAKLLEGMTDFVHRFAAEETDALNQRLRDLLYEFCGYSVLVDLAPKNGERVPCQVTHVECRFQGANEQDVREQVATTYANNWEGNWVGRLYTSQAWRHQWAHFTDKSEDFGKVNLTPGAKTETHQKADAILWLRRAEDVPPHRALLLMWGLPPPMSDADVELLGTIARLFSELDTRKQRGHELVQKNLIGEEAAQIGHVMQHFRHRLGNLTGGTANQIEALEAAFHHRDADGFAKGILALKENTRDIANAFHRSRGYVKKIEMQPVLITDLVAKALPDLNARLVGVELDIGIPEGLKAETDLEIAALVLYFLLQNALDATEDRPAPKIRIQAEPGNGHIAVRVTDNGTGVAPSVRNRLFQWGITTKSDGLGSALAFARTRMELLNGDLIFPTPQPAIGAAFEILLARLTAPENTP